MTPAQTRRNARMGDHQKETACSCRAGAESGTMDFPHIVGVLA